MARKKKPVVERPARPPRPERSRRELVKGVRSMAPLAVTTRRGLVGLVNEVDGRVRNVGKPDGK